VKDFTFSRNQNKCYPDETVMIKDKVRVLKFSRNPNKPYPDETDMKKTEGF
jgi:hypothetical protein